MRNVIGITLCNSFSNSVCSWICM